MCDMPPIIWSQMTFFALPKPGSLVLSAIQWLLAAGGERQKRDSEGGLRDALRENAAGERIGVQEGIHR